MRVPNVSPPPRHRVSDDRTDTRRGFARVVLLVDDETDARALEVVRIRRPDWVLDVHSSRSGLLEAVLDRPDLVLIHSAALPHESLQRTVMRLRSLDVVPVVLGGDRAIDGCPVVELGDDWTVLDDMVAEALG